ncbi:CLUMA_CG005741, isoform A [Clunio marinus]|uniref:Cytochrome c oxidase assembly protein COX16 homolog, mitochondrial n=1 Tax=Clunio marinus TaxID=568069 RepID=A0A1J1HX72_9DIPT|nr:CLUMA_CG005741, isoform A [Clunio marinus]
MNLVEKFQKLSKRRSFKYGTPFLVLILGGSFALKEFTQLRYQYAQKKTIRPDELEAEGVKMKEPEEVTLEKVYEKVKEIDIDHWENIRGPRPWEETQQIKASN